MGGKTCKFRKKIVKHFVANTKLFSVDFIMLSLSQVPRHAHVCDFSPTEDRHEGGRPPAGSGPPP